MIAMLSLVLSMRVQSFGIANYNAFRLLSFSSALCRSPWRARWSNATCCFSKTSVKKPLALLHLQSLLAEWKDSSKIFSEAFFSLKSLRSLSAALGGNTSFHATMRMSVKTFRCEASMVDITQCKDQRRLNLQKVKRKQHAFSKTRWEDLFSETDDREWSTCLSSRST